ncbi:rab-GTPase-TBC domain-containing protein [Lasiosphaeris hirsuta]|uniref:Rab-GTPase-TBC domain-containing protein n=1 Tax=Lasiosphaeris hirsuta TaxID=260670 RepID=A0AA40DJB5_9PEZI|nr:rab-GTPase-TBC domain-containing protein [Lasiosphaeris hirsuta]
MAPQRFPSVRHKPTIASRPAVRLAAFRDDTGLIALRYEQTKQAEPPIPLPPRNPLRLRTTTTATARPPPVSAPARTPAPAAVLPITIVPPPVAPPQEQHPLFRTQHEPQPQADDWKRDSGLATVSSSITLREEYDEVSYTYQKILDDIADAPSVYPVDEQVASSPAPSLPATTVPLSKSTVSHSPASPPLAPSPTPTRAASLTKKLGKTFSIRSTSARRLRKKTLSEATNAEIDIDITKDKAASSDAQVVTMRDSPSNSSSSSNKTPPRARSPSAKKDDAARTSQTMELDFTPITTSIPEDSLWDQFSDLSFSKRGSIMFGGESPLSQFPMTKPRGGSATPLADEPATGSNAPDTASNAPVDTATIAATSTTAIAATLRVESGATTATPSDATTETSPAPAHENSPSVPSIRVVSMDVERESQKVRSLYESGDSLSWQDGGRISFCERLEPTEEVPSDEEENVVSPRRPNPRSDILSTSDLNPMHTPPITTPRSVSSLSLRRDSQVRKDYERAGGLEDWEDVNGADVDRYGFINQRRPVSRPETPDPRPPPFPGKKRNVLTKRPGSAYSSPPQGLRPPSRKVSARSLNTFTSELSTTSRRSARSSIRSATNRLPHNRDRRWMDEAGDMLAQHPGLMDIDEDAKAGKSAEATKRKEAERTEKWRRMAKVIKKGEDGQGMDFEFDAQNPKVIERTWKGIPDCWRAAAWHSFLVASAKTWKGTDETDEQLMAQFRRLQDVASSDDVQIDLDVPRTINGHIMFRKRYRGGQRLLFRVLHAISLYFPGTGYVQGMASLAATLLCYYDEEHCFVMMVRMWRYRGLERLYEPGFAGLMTTLNDFETKWLAGRRDVATKLAELGIDATAYGTRWYLTLFNLSIPFPAQLRVWDVFMLLGECLPEGASPPGSSSTQKGEVGSGRSSAKGLDVLHATSAALVHALRDVLLDSDFENAMKALTAWIPIKDEDLLMNVARAEWRRHRLAQGPLGRRKEKEKDKQKEKA